MHILMCINKTLCLSVCMGGEKTAERLCFHTIPAACWQPARLTPAQIFRESALTANGFNQLDCLNFACFLTDGHTAMPDVSRPTAERDGAANPSTLRLLMHKKKINMCVCILPLGIVHSCGCM